MRRMLAGIALVSAAVVIAGCTTTEAPDPDDVQQWLDEQNVEQDGQTAQMTGLATESDMLEQLTAGQGQVRVDFETPTEVIAFDFSCFGSESMALAFSMQSGSSYLGDSRLDLACEDSPHHFEAPVDGPVDWIAATGYNEDGFGAWSLVIR